jgi:DNA-binding PadR family transcriptional regulator
MEASSLDYLLVGLLSGGPRSGYDLRKQIGDSPLRLYSDSPGAIYPALRRLARRHWVEAGPPEGPRRRSAYRVTPEGLAAFVAWLRQPVEREDVERGADDLLLRFAFMGAVLTPSEVAGFLEQLESETRAHLATLQEFYARESSRLPLTGRLAFEFGLADHEARIHWAIKARKELEGPPPGSRTGGSS